MYKLIAIDVDGTLLTKNKKITTKTKDAIKTASKLGVKIVLTTGRPEQDGLKIKVVTPSAATRKLCFKYGIEVIPTCFIEEVAVAFDGCGEADENLYASKGGGGVFTKEKIIGALAKLYILLIDERKLQMQLNPQHVVSIEIVKASLGYVSKMVRNLGGDPAVRTTSSKDGYLITDDGNFILDIKFANIQDFKQLNDDINDIAGVIGTSLFIKEVNKLIVAGEQGVRVISRV